MKMFPVTVDILDGNYELFSKIVRGICHDYNNLLTPILAYPEIIKMDIKEGSNGLMLISAIESTAQEMLNINRQLMQIVAADQSEGGELDVHNAVETIKSIIAEQPLGSGVSLDVKCPKGCIVRCQYEDVITALHKVIQNSAESMSGDGVVTIHVEKASLPGKPLKAGTPAEKQSYVLISVSDTGHGIDPKHMKQIFEPFFTTKKTPAKRYVGLGLTLAYRLITVNGGVIGLESCPGKGTTVQIYLPSA